MDSIVNTYEKLFLLEGHKAFATAINYLLQTKRAKTLSEIAKKLSISASTLSMYMSGEKPVSRNSQEKLKAVYQVDLANPLTYEDKSWMDVYLKGGYNPVPAETHLKVYFSMRTLLNEQQRMIENLRRANESLKRVNVELYNILLQNETNLIDAQLKGKFEQSVFL